MVLDFYCQKRSQSDYDKSETYKYGSSSNSTVYYKKTKCVDKVKYVYVVESIRYGIIFQDSYHSCGDIYISLGPILGQLNAIFEKSTRDSWNEAVKRCPTIKDLFTFNYNRKIRIAHHPDYTNSVIYGGEKYIEAQKYYFLEYNDYEKIKKKMPYPDNSYETEALKALKETAARIINELKCFNNDVIKESKTNWMDIVALCFLGVVAVYAISEIVDWALPCDMSDIDTGDMGVDLDYDNSDFSSAISFKGKLPPNHSSDGYIFQGGTKYNGFDVYKKAGHTFYWDTVKQLFVKIK